MRFFSSRWHGGDLPDDESDAVIPAYEAHLARIRDRLPPSLRAFSESVSIHDGLLRACVVDHARGTVTLELLVGDLGAGYADLRLAYGGVQFAHTTLDTLALAARDPRAEALYDELDIAPDGALVHRWLWWPYLDVELRFTEFGYEGTPRADRDIVRADRVFTETRP